MSMTKIDTSCGITFTVYYTKNEQDDEVGLVPGVDIESIGVQHDDINLIDVLDIKAYREIENKLVEEIMEEGY